MSFSNSAGHEAHLHLFVFTIELFLRSFAGRMKFFFHSEDWMWNWLDVFIVPPSFSYTEMSGFTPLFRGRRPKELRFSMDFEWISLDFYEI